MADTAENPTLNKIMRRLEEYGLNVILSVGGHRIEHVGVKLYNACRWEFGNVINDTWHVTLVDGFEEELQTIDLEIASDSEDVEGIVAAIRGILATYGDEEMNDPLPVVAYEESVVFRYVKGYTFLETELERLGTLRAVFDLHIKTDRTRATAYKALTVGGGAGPMG